MSEPKSLDAAQIQDVLSLIVALERAVSPFVRRGITYAPMLHALAVFLAAQAVAADEPIESLLDNVRMLHSDCLAQTLIHQEVARAVSTC